MTHLVVMAKHPVAGAVKTRLAATLGAETACALYRAFVLDLAERLRPLPYVVTWHHWPPTAPFAGLVGGGRCRPQEGGDLGARMAHAVSVALADGAAAVLVIGADAPHVSAATLAEAAAALTAGTDVVLGPATDGGYYLIGLRAAPPSMLFTDIPWSTPDVLRTTRERIAQLGLTLHVLPSSFDVDEAADLAHLEAALRTGEVNLPHTAAVLAARAPGKS